MDGYTYIKKVLDSDGNNVDKLLSQLRNAEGKVDENSAVEFKASFMPKPGDSDGPDACSWNVVSSVIAIANSTGGCILLGIEDNGDVATDYTLGLSLDKYKIRLNEQFDKKQWKFDNKMFSIAPKYRDRLKNCLTVLNGRADGKDILIIHIKPIKPHELPIVYEKTIFNEKGKIIDGPSEFITTRSKNAEKKDDTKLSLDTIEDFLKRETSDPFFNQLWNDYPEKHFTSWIVLTSIIFTLITIAQCVLIYKDTYAKGFESKLMVLFLSLPVFFLADVFLRFIVRALRRLMLWFIGSCWISFSISSFVFVLKLFSASNELMPYSFGFRVLITLLLFLGISFFCFFLMPILIPDGYQNQPRKGNIPKPDEISVDHPHLTLEWKCVDAGIWWSDSGKISTPYGDWKMQKHYYLPNYRLLDPRSIMRCWGSQTEVLKAFQEVQKYYKEEIEKPNT